MDDMIIAFYSDRERPYGAFSNFAAYGFELDGRYWKTSEHYFQAQKFAGTEHEEQARLAPRRNSRRTWAGSGTAPCAPTGRASRKT